jgi:hypothetical protein
MVYCEKCNDWVGYRSNWNVESKCCEHCVDEIKINQIKENEK